MASPELVMGHGLSSRSWASRTWFSRCPCGRSSSPLAPRATTGERCVSLEAAGLALAMAGVVVPAGNDPPAGREVVRLTKLAVNRAASDAFAGVSLTVVPRFRRGVRVCRLLSRRMPWRRSFCRWLRCKRGRGRFPRRPQKADATLRALAWLSTAAVSVFSGRIRSGPMRGQTAAGSRMILQRVVPPGGGQSKRRASGVIGWGLGAIQPCARHSSRQPMRAPIARRGLRAHAGCFSLRARDACIAGGTAPRCTSRDRARWSRRPAWQRASALRRACRRTERRWPGTIANGWPGWADR